MANPYAFDNRRRIAERLRLLEQRKRDEAAAKVRAEDDSAITDAELLAPTRQSQAIRPGPANAVPGHESDETIAQGVVPGVQGLQTAQRAPASQITRPNLGVQSGDHGQDTPPRGMVAPAALWQQHEPRDPYFPVPHSETRLLTTTIPTSTGQQAIRLIAASLRGKLHAHEGLYREDSFDLRALPDGTCLLCVADGAGSRRHSRIGAALAVKHALDGIQAALTTISTSESQPAPQIAMQINVRSDDEVRAAISDGVRAAYNALHDFVKSAQNTQGTTFADLACTLLIAVITPDPARVAAYQIGDGLIGMVESASEQDTVTLLGTPDQSENAGTTLFVTSHPLETWLQRPITLLALEQLPWLVLLSSDGVSDDFEFGDGVRANIAKYLLPTLTKRTPVLAPETSAAQAETLLLEAIQYDRQGSMDDRTLALFTTAVTPSATTPASGAE